MLFSILASKLIPGHLGHDMGWGNRKVSWGGFATSVGFLWLSNEPSRGCWQSPPVRSLVWCLWGRCVDRWVAVWVLGSDVSRGTVMTRCAVTQPFFLLKLADGCKNKNPKTTKQLNPQGKWAKDLGQIVLRSWVLDSCIHSSVEPTFLKCLLGFPWRDGLSGLKINPFHIRPPIASQWGSLPDWTQIAFPGC